MSKDHRKLEGLEKKLLLDKLSAQYEEGGGRRRLTYLRKKVGWFVVVKGSLLLKRFIDVVVSATLLVVLFPLFLLVAFLIKCTDGGPILYISRRVGKWGEEFPFPKFRSMVMNAEAIKEQLDNDHGSGEVTFKMKKDPRVTWIGRFIRKASIDELPQLFCVLIGTMSLVGPRPPLVDEVEKYTLEERRRLDIKPGITCIWQVSGRGDIPFDKQVMLDLEYIESQSVWADLWILVKTVPAVLLGKGAY